MSKPISTESAFGVDNRKYGSAREIYPPPHRTLYGQRVEGTDGIATCPSPAAAPLHRTRGNTHATAQSTGGGKAFACVIAVYQGLKVLNGDPRGSQSILTVAV